MCFVPISEYGISKMEAKAAQTQSPLPHSVHSWKTGITSFVRSFASFSLAAQGQEPGECKALHETTLGLLRPLPDTPAHHLRERMSDCDSHILDEFALVPPVFEVTIKLMAVEVSKLG